MTRSKWAALVLVVAAAALVSWFGFFFYRDNFSTHYPIKTISAAVFRAGEIPYWNYHDAGGQPLAGNPNTLTFYPDNILYLFLPAHVAFNLHFLLHIAIAYFAMRAATRSHFGAALYVLSGVAISATAFYNLIVAVAMLPLVFVAVERRRALLLGIAFGLLALAGEPVVILGAAIAAAVLALGRLRIRDIAIAVGIAVVIASPQLIAYSEIAREVERSVGMSAKTVLNTSIHPIRIAEIFIWPFLGFLNDAGGGADRFRLFSTVFLGVIAVPALFRRSRYVVIVAAMLFLALGRNNPVVAAIVENVAAIRVIRFPEKFVLVAVAALVVLSSMFYRDTRWKPAWLAVTFVPLIWFAVRATPIDWFAPYDLRPVTPVRVQRPTGPESGLRPAREEYRARARALEPLFGAVAGLRYAITPSAEGMHALRSRMVLERFIMTSEELREKYRRLESCNVPGARPPAYFPDRMIAARNIYEEAAIVQDGHFDDATDAVVPVAAFLSSPSRVVRYEEKGQTIEVDVETSGRALLIVNQTYFTAWKAMTSAGELPTTPVNIDRLGIIVPQGDTTITLEFGRRRIAVIIAWIASVLALLLSIAKETHETRTASLDVAH